MKRLLVLLVAIAAAVALAGLYLPSDAASVGSAHVTRQSLDSDLSAIAGSPDYTCFLSEERQLAGEHAVPFLGAGSSSAKGGVYDTTFVDDWLGSMITDEVTAGVVARRGMVVDSRDLTTAKGVLDRRITNVVRQYASDVGAPEAGCGGSGAVVLSSLPTWFVSAQLRAEADQALLDARAAGAGLTTEGLSSYFSRHRDTFDKDCLSVIVVKSRKTAEKVESELTHGNTFAQVAAAVSITQQSAPSGGAVGCGVLAGTFLVPKVTSLSVGAVSPPISDDGVYWVAKLTSRSRESLAAVRGIVVTSMLSAGQTRADAELTAALKRASLSVDPAYGSTRSGTKLTLVHPPASPPATAVPSGVADTPTLTAASS